MGVFKKRDEFNKIISGNRSFPQRVLHNSAFCHPQEWIQGISIKISTRWLYVNRKECSTTLKGGLCYNIYEYSKKITNIRIYNWIAEVFEF